MFERLYTSSEIRKALDTYSRIRSFRKAQSICKIGKSTIQRWWHSFHSNIIRTKIQKKKSRRKRSPKYPNLLRDIRDLFQTPDLRFLTLSSIRFALPTTNGSDPLPSVSWIATTLKKARISRRRFVRTKVCPKSTDSLRDIYQQFKDNIVSLEDKEILCLDETAFSNLGNASYGYFSKGKTPLVHNVKRREKVSVVMAIHPTDGVVCRASQPMAFNKLAYLAFLKDVFVPSIPNGVKAVVMDNIQFHRSKEVVGLLQQSGITPLYIPPYSPRCNPIEEVFSLWKRLFRGYPPTTGCFLERIERSFGVLNTYKDMAPYYKHAREHVLTTCLNSG